MNQTQSATTAPARRSTPRDIRLLAILALVALVAGKDRQPVMTLGVNLRQPRQLSQRKPKSESGRPKSYGSTLPLTPTPISDKPNRWKLINDFNRLSPCFMQNALTRR